MNRDELVRWLIRVLVEIQELSGREVPPAMNERTVPIGGLAGFDSLNGLELMILLPEQIAWSGNNLCVSDDGKKALNIRQIAERLLETDNPSA